MRILIVEDEGKIRSGLVSLIRAHTPYKVVGEAKNGKEGLHLLRSLKPDLVITDIKMPEMDGLEMLEALHEMGVQQHAVILSGYSEFAYAQKALRIGADDYLLKPLTAEDVVALLHRVNRIIEKENNDWLEGMSLVLHQAVTQTGGEVELPGDLEARLLEPGRTNLVFMGCATSSGTVDRAAFLERIGRLCEDNDWIGIPFFFASTQELGCLLSGKAEEETLIRRFEGALRPGSQTAIWSAVPIASGKDLQTVYRSLREQLLFGMVLDVRRVLTPPLVAAYSYQDFVYPQGIASALRKCICKNDPAGVRTQGEAFSNYMRQHPYHPARIQEAYKKLSAMMLDTVREFHTGLYQQLRKQEYPERLDRARSFDDLEQVLGDLAAQMGQTQKRDDIRNFVIMKAMDYIREHYQKGITLEEIAQSLDLTPEYLGTLFNREMGVNFSSFIRDFRLSHAKRLLRSTDLKIYEIAAQVGYSDVKYFTRVFREQEGLSPKEYRGRKQGVEL